MTRIFTIFTVMMLAAWSAGCKGGLGEAGPDGAGPPGEVEGAAAAGRDANVALIVFVGQDQACKCTRERIEKSWSVLQTALAGGPEVEVKRIQWDVDEEEAKKYESMKPVMALPAIYFLDDEGSLIELLQGEVEDHQVSALLK